MEYFQLSRTRPQKKKKAKAENVDPNVEWKMEHDRVLNTLNENQVLALGLRAEIEYLRKWATELHEENTSCKHKLAVEEKKFKILQRHVIQETNEKNALYTTTNEVIPFLDRVQWGMDDLALEEDEARRVLSLQYPTTYRYPARNWIREAVPLQPPGTD